MIADVETHWSRELQSEVEIGQKAGEYTLNLDGHFVDWFPSVASIETFLNTLSNFKGLEIDGY